MTACRYLALPGRHGNMGCNAAWHVVPDGYIKAWTDISVPPIRIMAHCVALLMAEEVAGHPASALLQPSRWVFPVARWTPKRCKALKQYSSSGSGSGRRALRWSRTSLSWRRRSRRCSRAGYGAGRQAHLTSLHICLFRQRQRPRIVTGVLDVCSHNVEMSPKVSIQAFSTDRRPEFVRTGAAAVSGRWCKGWSPRCRRRREGGAHGGARQGDRQDIVRRLRTSALCRSRRPHIAAVSG